jgi:hypothetical protein
MPVEVDPEVGGEHEGEATVLLECGLLFEGGEIGAHEGGFGTVERGGEAVRGAVRGQRHGGAAYAGEVGAGTGAPVGATPFARTRGEEETQPFEGATDRVVHVDAP